MNRKFNKVLFAAILRLMKPLVRILLRNGIAYGTFLGLLRKVYVDVAYIDFAPAGKKEKVGLVRHAFVPCGDPLEKIQVLGTDVAELITIIAHNLTARQDELLFQRKVAYDNIDLRGAAQAQEDDFREGAGIAGTSGPAIRQQ